MSADTAVKVVEAVFLVVMISKLVVVAAWLVAGLRRGANPEQ